MPKERDPVRHRRLERHLRDLWRGAGAVDVRRCDTCGFAFADPNVAGDREFYNLVSGGDPHYPSTRWEFGRTLEELSHLPNVEGRLLECGAGEGRFLVQLRSSPVGARFSPVAAEYDEGALRRLRAAGIAVWAGSITELAEDEGAGFAVICMFQTLEHIDDVHGVFASFRRLGLPGSHIFVSVPNGAAVDTQERLVCYWDMPPNHVGRWTESCFGRMAIRHGLRLVRSEIEPASRIAQTWRLAVYRVNSQAYEPRSLAGRISTVGPRRVRGPLKRLLAGVLFARLWPAMRSTEGRVLWVHLRNPD